MAEFVLGKVGRWLRSHFHQRTIRLNWDRNKNLHGFVHWGCVSGIRGALYLRLESRQLSLDRQKCFLLSELRQDLLRITLVETCGQAWLGKCVLRGSLLPQEHLRVLSDVVHLSIKGLS